MVRYHVTTFPWSGAIGHTIALLIRPQISIFHIGPASTPLLLERAYLPLSKYLVSGMYVRGPEAESASSSERWGTQQPTSYTTVVGALECLSLTL